MARHHYRRLAVIAAALASVSGGDASAQTGSGVVQGTVRDIGGQPVAGAEVTLLPAGIRTRTGDQGTFRVASAPLGPITLQVRRLGFRMETTSVQVARDASTLVALQLQPAGTLLAPVVVRGRKGRYTGRLAGFYERLESSVGGTFLTRDRIEEGAPRNLTTVLQRVPGLEIIRGGRVRMRGRTCAPLVWIDGVAMPAGEVDLNTFAPSSLEGIELYLTASGAPFRYQSTVDRGRCGTILLWSRGPDTDLRRAVSTTPPSTLEQRHAEQTLFTVSDVDEPARPDTSVPMRVVYPPELLAERVTGSVLAEVVVDSTGRTEAGTFGIVFSSHPLFTRAVQEAVRSAVFVPASRAGRRVPQVVQIPVRFDPPGRR